ncbi:MAG: exopolysaccharide biosynthesis protein [Microcoleaceae cyanobacterium]
MHLKFSKDLETLLEQLAHHPLTLRDILTETSERGFCLLIGFFALPFLFPMPPGFSTILGSGCLVLSLQMALGRREPWLPKKVADFQFSSKFAAQLLGGLRRVTRSFEKITRPRLSSLTKGGYMWRINGLCLAWLALMLMLPIPIPYSNFPPAIAIFLMAVAMMEGDGLLICVGYVLMVLNTALFVGLPVYIYLFAPDLLRSIQSRFGL